MSPVRVILSGCSGGGKSTLIAELARRGLATMAEPGRRVVREGIDYRAEPERFALRAAALAIADHDAASGGVTVYDRSLLDAAAWFLRTGRALPGWIAEAVASRRYASPVFLAPPWPALFAPDAERRHDFAEAEAEYAALVALLPGFGYATTELPRLPVAARADWLLGRLDLLPRGPLASGGARR